MLFAAGPGFEEFEAGALLEDTKAGLTLGIGHPRSWKRTAIVTDVDWIAKATRMFAWMAPGELNVYPPRGTRGSQGLGRRLTLTLRSPRAGSSVGQSSGLIIR